MHTIGRDSKKNVTSMRCSTINNLMSKKHAELSVSRDGVHHLKDLNTLNGTYVNGALISTDEEGFALRNGDVISFGGPLQVVIGGKTLRNPFRYAYYRLPSVTVWSEATRGIDRPPALPDWLDAKITCGICLEHMTDPHSINGCGHVFCKACISCSIDTQDEKRCPACNQGLPDSCFRALISPDLLVRGMVDRVESNFTSLDEVRKRAEHREDIEKRSSDLRKQALRTPPRVIPYRSMAHEVTTARHRIPSFDDYRVYLRRMVTNVAPSSTLNEVLRPGSNIFVLRPGAGNVSARTNAATPPSGNENVVGSQNNGQTLRSETDTRVSWRGSGVTQTRDVRCATCGLGVRAKCFRLVRTCQDDTKHFHAHVTCVRRYAHELKTPDVTAEIDADITDQQKRVTTGLFRCFNEETGTA